jgi:hypothetical protein
MQVDEINISNFVNTGQMTPFPRYTFSLEIKYTTDNGEKRTHGPVTYTFPNDLASMPLEVRREFAIRMIDAVARVSIGAATWDQYL